MVLYRGLNRTHREGHISPPSCWEEALQKEQNEVAKGHLAEGDHGDGHGHGPVVEPSFEDLLMILHLKKMVSKKT